MSVLEIMASVLGKLGLDSNGQAIQTMPLAKEASGTITIRTETLVELEDSADITVTFHDDETVNIVAEGLRQYSIRGDVKSIEINDGTVRVV